MIFALINNGVVVNTIVADQTFANLISNQYQYIIQITNEPGQPSIGWLYDGVHFSPTPNPGSPPDPIAQALAAAQFGQALMAQFSIVNNQRGLSVSDRVQLASELASVQSILLCGDLASAIAILQATTPDGVLLTQDILNDFIAQIQAYQAGSGA